MRAANHGRSTEAEVRAILEGAVKPEGRVRLGALLVGIGKRAALKEGELAVFARDKSRDTGPFESADVPTVDPWKA
jgi:plasmid stability protein